MPNGVIASTRKGSSVYISILRPVSGPLTLPAIPAKIKSASLIGGGKVSFKQTPEGVTIDFPGGEARALDTVVKLNLEGSAMDIAAIGVPKPASKLPDGEKVTASSVWLDDNRNWSPEKAFDSNYDTRWAAGVGVKQAWVAIEYDKPQTFSSLAVNEGWDRVRAFELQCRDGSGWKTVLKGTTLGESYSKSFDPVTSSSFRLDISEATDSPTIGEIKLK